MHPAQLPGRQCAYGAAAPRRPRSKAQEQLLRRRPSGPATATSPVLFCIQHSAATFTCRASLASGGVLVGVPVPLSAASAAKHFAGTITFKLPKLNLHCLITSALDSFEDMVGRRAGGRECTHDAHHCIIYIRAVCLAMSSLQAAYRTHRPGRARLHTPGCLLQQSR